jgi:hypothetical protein
MDSCPQLESGERTQFVVTSGAPAQLGFLTILQEANGFLGGYLVTNLWGRPLEFRLSTAVQPNRVQQILYGPTLADYVHGDVIGRTLVEKTGTPASLIFTDRQAALDVRRHFDLPVVWIAHNQANLNQHGIVVRVGSDREPALVSHERFENDLPRIRDIVGQLNGFDLLEPFSRIREAIAEARKLGVTSRG